jgi:DNA-binding SARP family transcriptional activator/TolB-like protein
MLSLNLLGALELRDTQGREVDAVLRQPKRLALLVYLALARPARFHRRDALLGRFWPDLDESHARASLRRALYFLRRELGEHVLENRGDEEVGISPGTIRCDVLELEAQLAAGRTAEALALYRGDLLESFYVSGAPAVEAWLDQERTRLREAVGRAALVMARAGGDGDTVERWARMAHELTPHDEASAGLLVATLAGRGDRAGARRTWDAFHARLAQDLSLAPSAALADRVRALLDGPSVRDPLPAVAPAPPASDLVLILPFTIRGDSGLAYLGEGFVDLLSTKLEGVGAYRVVEPRTALAIARSASVPPADAAARIGAGLILEGSLLEAGGEIAVTATLRMLDGRVLRTAESRTTGEAGLFALVDELARRLLLPPHEASDRSRRLSSLTTDSLPALKAWLAGEQAFRQARYQEAGNAFGRAASLDPAFALGHYRHAASLAAGVLIEPARDASARALATRDRLGHHDRLLVEAQHAWLRGASGEAERRYAEIVTGYPESQEGWFLLGDVQMHSNPYRGKSIALARPALERAHALDPKHLGAILQLVRLAAHEARHQDLERLIQSALALEPGRDISAGLRAVWAHAAGTDREQAAASDGLVEASGIAIGRSFSDVALYTPDLRKAERFGTRLFAAARSEEFRAFGHLVLAHVALARGGVIEAFDRIREADRLDPSWALEVRGLFASLPFLPLEPALRHEVRDALRAWNPSDARPSFAAPLALHNNLHPHLHQYLMGLLSLRLGDADGAREASEALEELPIPAAGAPLVAHLVRTLQADRLRSAGAIPEALAVLEMPAPDVWFQLVVASPFFAGAYERLLRGDLLAAAGRPVEALAWWDAIAERSPFELPFRAPALERQAAVWRDLGDSARAGRCADRARVLWGAGPG